MSRLAAGILSGGGVPGNDAFAKILLHMDGANGGTTFTDANAGGVSATWSVVSSASLTTANKKFGSASYQGAVNSFIKSNQTSVYWPGSGDFTIDFWFRLDASTTATRQVLAVYGGSTNDGTSGAQSGCLLTYLGNGSLSFNLISAGVLSMGNAAYSGFSTKMDGNWHHLEVNRSGSTPNIFIDGVSSVTSSAAISGTMATSPTFTINVGGSPTPSFTNPTLGNIDEFRYSVGIARHTANFTPPTGPYN